MSKYRTHKLKGNDVEVAADGRKLIEAIHAGLLTLPEDAMISRKPGIGQTFHVTFPSTVRFQIIIKHVRGDE